MAFVAQLAPGVAVIEDNDHFYHAVRAGRCDHTEKAIRDQVNAIIEAIQQIGQPTDIATVAKQVGDTDKKHVEALASISKNLATLKRPLGSYQMADGQPQEHPRQDLCHTAR